MAKRVLTCGLLCLLVFCVVSCAPVRTTEASEPLFPAVAPSENAGGEPVAPDDAAEPSPRGVGTGLPDEPDLPSDGEGSGEGEVLPPPAGPDVSEVPDVSEEANVPPEPARYIRSKTNGLYIRTGAGTSFRALGTLDKGDMVAYVGEKNGWYETRYRGQTAYVSANPSYTELYETPRASDPIEAVIRVGCEYLGTPYVYGATRLLDGNGNFLQSFTTNAFDCSSYMQYILYAGAGVRLQVNTRTQVMQGEPVERAALRRGDLLFFTNASRKNNVGVERIGHVALYLGDNYILHTASDHAVIEPISSARWNNFICARRVGALATRQTQ